MNVRLVEIKQDVPGFDSFLGSWTCQGDLNVVIDVGPAKSAGRLIDSLVSLGLDRLDLVLLTHIHIDHAGGLAEVLDHYPGAKVMCHEKAIPYLVDPSALWAGSLKVLGKTAEMYGPPKPVQKERLIPHTENNFKDLLVVETPGHAIHHLSFSFEDRLFAGEAGGIYIHINGEEYVRPSTPPRFLFDVCMKSVEHLLALKDQPIYFAHFGEAESSHRLLEISRLQLLQWKEIIYDYAAGGQMEDADLINRCIDTLLEEDPNLAAFGQMDPETRKRERFFMANSVKGFIGFFKEDKQPVIKP
jgi:glyoxylase-like metal-dependent hydrolase (beta-lactamase superfamily II)